MKLIYYCFLLVFLSCNNASKRSVEKCFSSKEIIEIGARECCKELVQFKKNDKYSKPSFSESSCFNNYKFMYSVVIPKSNELYCYYNPTENSWIFSFKVSNSIESIKILDIENVFGYSIFNDVISIYYSEKSNSVPVKKLILDGTNFLIYTYEFFYLNGEPYGKG